jgi:hypothetical protein
MPISTKVTELVTKPLPKVISPRIHAIIDYGTAAAFFTAGALLWNKNKRASLAAYLCADIIGSLMFLTDAPGGVWKKISFETHGKIDPGLAALAASAPNFLGFTEEKESKLFQTMGVALAAVGSMTDYEEGSSNADTRRRAA